MVTPHTSKNDTAKNDGDKNDAVKVEPTKQDKATMPRDIELLDDPVQERVYRDPFLQTGTMDTSGTGGGVDNSVEAISPIFAESRRQNLQTAARALDPHDEEVPSELVVLPEGSVTVTGTTKTAEEGKDDVFRALEKANEAANEAAPARSHARPAEEDSTTK
jgi:hypothetical protein